MDTESSLLQLLADRTSNDKNSIAAQLLGRLIDGNGGTPPEFHDILAAIAEQNPALQPLCRRLEQVQASRKKADDPSGTGSLEDDRPSTAMLELQTQLESVIAELQRLRERNEKLACALGACPLCWGEDEECRGCRGRGQPGFAVPDESTFLAYVLPAARLWRLQRLSEHPRHAPVRRGTGPDAFPSNERR